LKFQISKHHLKSIGARGSVVSGSKTYATTAATQTDEQNEKDG
jgi:hypothetical protein